MNKKSVNEKYNLRYKVPCPKCGNTVLGQKNREGYPLTCPNCGWVDVWECELCGVMGAEDRGGHLLCSACNEEAIGWDDDAKRT